ncbi:uncharacterized protein LOC126661299 [Mercurialis annua]|uniref:uncharacterized protein LOC126661299 n=1 Tax=Mercurialis annua TaxID=3986 RepID=UPI00215F4566|nr:uncharacterized protein LOC126661299 [Mercurialis annua]
MAISLNSVVGFNSKFPAKYHHVSTSSIRASSPKSTKFAFFSGTVGSRVHIMKGSRGLCLSVANSDRLATDITDKGSDSTEGSISDNQIPVVDSPEETSQFQTSVANENGSTVSSDAKLKKKPDSQSTSKRSSLTARERLKAARVRSRYTEPKASKLDKGRTVLDALKEGDKGKMRSGLPEAPSNMLDDSDRGLPKAGLTFDFPGGSDLFVIAISFVLISTIMFTTTFIVWKVGAIHFNEF